MNFMSDDRGSSLIATMIAAVVGFLLLALIASGILTFMNFYLSISSTNAVTAQKANADQQFRTDIAWASNIPSETSTADTFTAFIPHLADQTCTEVKWGFHNVSGKRELLRTAKVFTLIIAPATNATATPGSTAGASICGGQLKHEHSEVVISDAGAAAKFTYTNASAITLTRSGNEMAAAATPGATLMERAAFGSTRIAGVALQTRVADSGNKASDLTVVQYSKSLEVKDLPLTSKNLGAVRLGAS